MANKVRAICTQLNKAQATPTLCHGVQHSCLLQVLPEGLFLAGLCCHVVSDRLVYLELSGLLVVSLLIYEKGLAAAAEMLWHGRSGPNDSNQENLDFDEHIGEDARLWTVEAHQGREAEAACVDQRELAGDSQSMNEGKDLEKEASQYGHQQFSDRAAELLQDHSQGVHRVDFARNMQLQQLEDVVYAVLKKLETLAHAAQSRLSNK